MPGEAYYEGAHSLTFSKGTRVPSGKRTGYLQGYNTWTTWHLIPTSKPVVAGPSPKTNYIEIPGRDGAIDMSTYLTGGIVFGARSGSWEFIIDNGWEHWETTRRDIYEKLHGQEFKVVLEDVPMQYWTGRVAISDYKAEQANNKVTINYVLDPYSHSVLLPSDQWLWDPFNFETDRTDGVGREEARL